MKLYDVCVLRFEGNSISSRYRALVEIPGCFRVAPPHRRCRLMRPVIDGAMIEISGESKQAQLIKSGMYVLYVCLSFSS